jgi:hypothetical protein
MGASATGEQVSEPRPGPFLVWTRAALLGAIALLSGTAAHVSAGGLLPSSIAMVGLLVIATLAATRCVLHRASALRLVALVLAGQTLIHLMLSALAGHHEDLGVAGSSSGSLAHLVHHLSEQDPLMVLAHLVAAAVLGGWLAVGESALWTALVLVTARLCGWASALLPVTVDGWARPGRCDLRHSRTPCAHVVRRRALVVGTVTHRGPPLLPSC